MEGKGGWGSGRRIEERKERGAGKWADEYGKGIEGLRNGSKNRKGRKEAEGWGTE